MAVSGVAGSGSAISSPIYHRRYSPLKRLNLVWRATTVIAAAYAWFLTLPWLALKYVAPSGSVTVAQYLSDAEQYFFQYATPYINALQDLTYRVFDLFDYALDQTIIYSTHIYQTYLKDATALSDYYLSLAESRTALLQDYGLNGIRYIFSSGPTTGASAPIGKPVPLSGTAVSGTPATKVL